MGMVSGIKWTWRLLLVLVMLVALAACVVLVGINWGRTQGVDLLVGKWEKVTVGPALGVAILLGAFSWLMISRIPKIRKTMKADQKKRQAKQDAKDAKVFREQHKQGAAAPQSDPENKEV